MPARYAISALCGAGVDTVVMTGDVVRDGAVVMVVVSAYSSMHPAVTRTERTRRREKMCLIGFWFNPVDNILSYRKRGDHLRNLLPGKAVGARGG